MKLWKMFTIYAVIAALFIISLSYLVGKVSEELHDVGLKNIINDVWEGKSHEPTK